MDEQLKLMAEQNAEMRKVCKEFDTTVSTLTDQLTGLRDDLGNIFRHLTDEKAPPSKRHCPTPEPPVPPAAVSKLVVAAPSPAIRVDQLESRGQIVYMPHEMFQLDELLRLFKSSSLDMQLNLSRILADSVKVKRDFYSVSAVERASRVAELPYQFYYVNMKGHKDAKYEQILLSQIDHEGKLIAWKIKQTRYVPARESRHFAFGPGSEVPLTFDGSPVPPAKWFGVKADDPLKTLDVVVFCKADIRASTIGTFTVDDKTFFIDKHSQVLKQLTWHPQPPNSLGLVPDWWVHVGNVKLSYPHETEGCSNIDVVWFNNTEEDHSYVSSPDGFCADLEAFELK